MNKDLKKLIDAGQVTRADVAEAVKELGLKQNANGGYEIDVNAPNGQFIKPSITVLGGERRDPQMVHVLGDGSKPPVRAMEGSPAGNGFSIHKTVL